jgi:hypothetical protein
MSAITNPNIRAEQRADLDYLITKYLAGGGKITKYPTDKRELPATYPIYAQISAAQAKADGLMP